MKRILAILAMVVATAPASAAQPYSRTTISSAQADIIMAAALAEARKRDVALAIVIVDETGAVVMAKRMDGALPHSMDIAERKAKTSALVGQPSRIVGDRVARGHTAILSIDDMMPMAGAMPVRHEGRVIGAIGASGSPADIDEAVSQAGIAVLDEN